MTSRDFRWLEVTSKWRLTRSHLAVAVESRKLAYTVHFTFYKTVARSRRQSRDMKWWPEMTQKLRNLTGSSFELGVKGRKLLYTLHFTSYKAVARSRRHSRVRKWLHMTSGDRKYRNWRHLAGCHLEVAVEGRKLAYTVHFSSYKTVARSRRRSLRGNDITWHQGPEIT